MKLKKAIELYKQEEKATSNAYEWYRRSAKENCKITISNVDIPTYKENNIWFVDVERFNEAIKEHRRILEQIKKNTEDHKKGIIHGKDGDIICTEWGGCKIHENFRFEWQDYLIAHGKSDGVWYCIECNVIAEKENNKEECHVCNDWGSCGDDCTLSKVYCPKCKKFINF